MFHIQESSVDLKDMLARNSTNLICLRRSLCFILIFEAVLDGSRNVGWQLSSAMPLKTHVPAYVVFIKKYYMLTLFLHVNWVFLLGLTSQFIF